MAEVQDITAETDFSDVDAFLNAEAAKSKEYGLESDTAVEVCTAIWILDRFLA
jgi:hypothetical protein